jgi:hypothetical protein
MLTKLIRLITALSLILVAQGCASMSKQEFYFIEWQEEVKLNSGKVITVTQKRRCDEQYPKSCLTRESWLTINLSEFGKAPIIWSQKLEPMVLNVNNGALYVVGWPPTQYEFRLYDRPMPPYVGYRFNNGKWTRIPLKEIPIEIYDTNLLIDSPDGSIKRVTLSMKESAAYNGDPRYSRDQKRIDPSYKTKFD